MHAEAASWPFTNARPVSHFPTIASTVSKFSIKQSHSIGLSDGTVFFFEGVRLTELGISISAHHRDATPCKNKRSHGLITVIDVNGFHEIELYVCKCDGCDPVDLQLFSLRLFPASVLTPRTAFTFNILEQFRLIHLEAKTSANSFVQALIRLTTDEYMRAWPIRDRGREFQRVARQWNYLLANRSALILDKSANPLAPQCPACPHPGMNMDANWFEKTPSEKHWLARQFVHFDANFRLVLEKRAQPSQNGLGLWENKCFFVGNERYNEYLKKMDTTQRSQHTSTCSDYRALSTHNRSRFQSLDVTGVAGAVCRHECILPGSFINLYKGERFINSDYAISNLFSTLTKIKEVVITYDIACQYAKHFLARIQSGLPYLSLPIPQLRWLVPKFHLAVHRDDCQYQYSLNYFKGVGRTDGEAIERTWSTHNHLSGSTSKMTPGFRLDTLELHFSDWNLQKGRRMGRSLHIDLLKAREQVEIHTARFKELRDGLPPASINKWINEEQNFDVSRGERNIYKAMNEKAPSKSMVLTNLKGLENPRNSEGNSEELSTTVAWVNEGLEIEETQLYIQTKRSSVNSGSMERDHVLLAHARTSLWERILNWRDRSPLEFGDPEANREEPEFPEDHPITLPSSLPNISRPHDLANLELQLREGQANDALRTIRSCLSQRLVLNREKKNNRSQHNGRLLNNAVGRFEVPINQAATQYRKAYNTMIQLGMRQDHPVYRPLEDKDLTAGNVFNPARPLGRGHEPAIPWIWYNSGVVAQDSLADNWLEEVIRVQFLDAKVNRDRWIEETELLDIELDRTRQYFRFFSQEWDSFAQKNSGGRAAYGKRMAAKYSILTEDVPESHVDRL